jgi:hypothetical protein
MDELALPFPHLFPPEFSGWLRSCPSNLTFPFPKSTNPGSDPLSPQGLSCIVEVNLLRDLALAPPCGNTAPPATSAWTQDGGGAMAGCQDGGGVTQAQAPPLGPPRWLKLNEPRTPTALVSFTKEPAPWPPLSASASIEEDKVVEALKSCRPLPGTPPLQPAHSRWRLL